MIVKAGIEVIIHGRFLEKDMHIFVHEDVVFSGDVDLGYLEEKGIVTVKFGKRNYSLRGKNV